MECLHRFCHECIQKCLRVGKKECPSCRIHIPSRRSLRPDPEFDALIRNILGDLDVLNQQEEEQAQKARDLHKAFRAKRKRGMSPTAQQQQQQQSQQRGQQPSTNHARVSTQQQQQTTNLPRPAFASLAGMRVQHPCLDKNDSPQEILSGHPEKIHAILVIRETRASSSSSSSSKSESGATNYNQHCCATTSETRRNKYLRSGKDARVCAFVDGLFVSSAALTALLLRSRHLCGTT